MTRSSRLHSWPLGTPSLRLCLRPPCTTFHVHREVIPTRTASALNAGRIIVELGHPNHEQLRQDQVHRRRPAAREGLLLC
ncbi:hypothetical protein VULLAG_LOCUS12364 [Vulpes lagopus]